MRKQQILYKQFWTKIKTRQETNSKHIKIVPDEKKRKNIFNKVFFLNILNKFLIYSAGDIKENFTVLFSKSHLLYN